MKILEYEKNLYVDEITYLEDDLFLVRFLNPNKKIPQAYVYSIVPSGLLDKTLLEEYKNLFPKQLYNAISKIDDGLKEGCFYLINESFSFIKSIDINNHTYYLKPLT